MPTRTHAHDGVGTSRGSGEETPIPPLVPPTLAKAITALLNATAQYSVSPGDGRKLDSPARRSRPKSSSKKRYLYRILRNSPPVFIEVEEPLEADEWIRVMEHKFGLIRCTETQKPLFAA
jgi:hypothetical protein